mmetsp:Transcript_15236/g.36114  ORF Transcript_15236/g.36114 Transcript_15236/m.36114 type:complete len:98 (+) Transcript_15236:132-425(+)
MFRQSKCTASSAFATAAGADKSTENSLGSPGRFITLTVMAQAGRGPLVDEDGFAQEVVKRQFSHATDVAVCARISARRHAPPRRARHDPRVRGARVG